MALSGLTMALVLNPTTISAANIIQRPDSIVDNFDYDEVEARKDTTGRTHKNFAKNENVNKYILGSRFRKYGDSFSYKWYDHMYNQFGLDLERVIPPSNKYRYDVLMGAHVGLGKELNRFNSIRVLLHSEIGYQRQWDYTFYRIGGQLDYLFSMSDYFNGYNPSRLLSVYSVIGAGLEYEKSNDRDKNALAPEFHAGAQMRFYTGPRGYFAIEPYAGLGGDQMDLSDDLNWKKFDPFFGLKLSYMYYLSNNLSREARSRYLDGRTRKNYLTRDSTLFSWRMPWFIEVANGANFNRRPQGNLKEGFSTMGSDLTYSIGKWLSPVIGVRFSAFSRSSAWLQNSARIINADDPGLPHKADMVFFGGRVEALFNPLGFDKNYNWDKPFGFHFTFGMEYGQLRKYNGTIYNGSSIDFLKVRAMGYSAGVHLWTRLSRDLQFFIEPRYGYAIYRKAYTNVDWYNRCTEHTISLNAGMTMLIRSLKYRRIGDSDMFTRHVKQWAFGLTGGLNFMQNIDPVFNSDHKISWNGSAYAEYHFNYVSAARFTAEFVNHHVAEAGYYGWNTDAGKAYARFGVWNHMYRIGLASLSYDVNLTSLFSGHKNSRTFESEFFFGPTFAYAFDDNGTLDSSNPLKEGESKAWYVGDAINKKTTFGGHFGFKIMGNVTDCISIVLTPTVYVIKDLSLRGAESGTLGNKLSLMETLSLGVQYRFQVFK